MILVCVANQAIWEKRVTEGRRGREREREREDQRVRDREAEHFQYGNKQLQTPDTDISN